LGAAGETPNGRKLAIVTGGGPGIMETTNRGAFDAGAATAGFDIAPPRNRPLSPYTMPELCFRFHYFAMRKLRFMLEARAFLICGNRSRHDILDGILRWREDAGDPWSRGAFARTGRAATKFRAVIVWLQLPSYLYARGSAPPSFTRRSCI
jgi:hypothetical protein